MDSPQCFQTTGHTHDSQYQHSRTGFVSQDALTATGSHGTLDTRYPVQLSATTNGTLKQHGLMAEPLKRALEPNIHQVSSDWSSSEGTLGSQDEKRRNLLSPTSTDFKAITPVPTTPSGNWIMEFFAFLVALGAAASIIGLLARFNGKALPSWPYKITLNALIAVLTTIANTAMSVVLSSGLGQLKWDRAKRGYVPLADMVLLDDASRGAWGSLKLLPRAGGG